MKNKLKKIWPLVFLGLALTSVWAETGNSFRDNEDLRYIRDWRRNQRLQTLAQQLALTSRQVVAFRSLKGRVAELDADFQARLDAVETEVAEAARQIRQRLEAGGALEAVDWELLKTGRSQLKTLHKQKRLKLRLMALDIESILTESQKEMLRARVRGKAGRRALARRSSIRLHAARILLSDDFLEQLKP